MHSLLRKLREDLRDDPEGTAYCLKLDVRKFYPSIDHDKMKAVVRRKIKDRTKGLCMMPTAVGGSASTYYPDYFYTNGATQTGLRVRAAGGSAYYGTYAGAFYATAYRTATYANAGYSSPLCVFVDDPTIEA